MSTYIPQPQAQIYPSHSRHLAPLLRLVLAAWPATLLIGCAMEPYPPLPAQPQGGVYGSYSALPGPVEAQGPVHRFAGESEVQSDTEPDGQSLPASQPTADSQPVADVEAKSPVQPEAWRGDPAAFIGPPRPGPRKLVIHLNKQRFEYSEGGTVVHTGQVTSGSAEHPTPKGAYRVLSKDLDKRSGSYTNYFDMPTPMPYSLQFNGPYYVHEGWVAGQPESHGCVRLHYEDARFVYERMKVGDPITVVN
jgi:hypothetical protein